MVYNAFFLFLNVWYNLLLTKILKIFYTSEFRSLLLINTLFHSNLSLLYTYIKLLVIVMNVFLGIG